MASAAKPEGNGYDPKKVTRYVSEIEKQKKQITSKMMAAVESCKANHEAIRDILTEAKETAGIPKGALRSVIKARELERKAAEVRDDLEGDDQDSFDMIRHALGDLADTPLGRSALEVAEARA